MGQQIHLPAGGDAVIYSEASSKQRALAYALDLSIWGALWGLVQSVIVEFDAKMSLELVGAVLYAVQFIVFPAFEGQTPAKLMMGLRVVPSDLGNAQARISIGRLLIRETIGRFLSTVIFGMGYWVAIFRNDRRGWHDQISSTRVTTVEKIPPWAAFACTTAWWASSIVTIVCAAHVLLFSPWPVREIFAQLKSAGYMPSMKFTHITGGFFKGYTFHRFQFQTPIGKTELDDFQIRVRLHQETTTFVVTLEGSSSSHSRFVIPGKPKEFAFTLINRLKNLMTIGLPAEISEGAWPITWRISNLDISNLEVVTLGAGTEAGSEPVKVDRLFVNDLVYSRGAAIARLGRLFMQSSILYVDVQDVGIESSLVRIEKPAYFLVQPLWAPDWIRRPIDIRLQGRLLEGKFQSLKLDAFAGLVKAQAEGEAGELAISALTLQHFFYTEIPLYNLDLSVKVNVKPFKVKSLTGAVSLRSVRFTVEEGGTLFHPRDNIWYSILPKLSELAALKPDLKQTLVIRSNSSSGVRDSLAQLYFTRPLKELDPAQIAYVEHDFNYFEPHPSDLAPPVIDTPEVRAPSAVRKKAKHGKSL
jgi:uncharacterized RDD family membrane protein YckC